MQPYSTTRERRATSADVAREAGVSRATVSYVLNDKADQTIPDATRRRVLDAAARLGYAPSAAARTLRRGRSDLVMCLIPAWPLGSAAGGFLTAASKALHDEGLELIVHIYEPDHRQLANLWKSVTPAAVVVLGKLTDDDAAATRAAGIATVELGYSDGTSQSGRLTRSDALVGRLQAAHLAERGHRRLGYAYPEESSLRDFADPRLAGARDEGAARGLPPIDVRTVPLDPRAAAKAVTAWLATGVTGVCAYNDEVAIALLAGLRQHRLTSPDDLAIVGADNIPIAALTSPPLTTIALDHETEADRIVRAVLHALGDAPEPPPMSPELFTLLVRETT